MVRFGKRCSAAVVLAVLLGVQAATLPGITYAAYAVQDDVVRENTDKIKTEAEGIHKDTTSIDKTTQSIDKTTQKILEYVTRVWRQGEQESRSLEETESDKGDLSNSSVADLSSSGFDSILSGFVTGNTVKINYQDILGPLSGKDAELYGKLNQILAAYKGGGWSGFKGAVKDKLTVELQELMRTTKHQDVFPGLSNEDYQDLLAGRESASMDEFWQNKFPQLSEEIRNEKSDISKIRNAVKTANDQIYDELAKSRKQTAAARVTISDEMKESQKRLSDLMELLPHAEGTKQVRQLDAMIRAESNYLQALQLQMDLNYQQERSLAMQADEQINRNLSEGERAEINTGTYLTEGYVDSYEAWKNDNSGITVSPDTGTGTN